MKKILVVLFFAFAVFSCEDREPEEVTIPDWLKPRLEELENSGECHDCKVQRWTYNDAYFYHIYCGHWSCIDCEVYWHNGEKIVWGEGIDHADYEQNKHRPMVIWQCGDKL